MYKYMVVWSEVELKRVLWGPVRIVTFVHVTILELELDDGLISVRLYSPIYPICLSNFVLKSLIDLASNTCCGNLFQSSNTTLAD